MSASAVMGLCLFLFQFGAALFCPVHSLSLHSLVKVDQMAVKFRPVQLSGVAALFQTFTSPPMRTNTGLLKVFR